MFGFKPKKIPIPTELSEGLATSEAAKEDPQASLSSNLPEPDIPPLDDSTDKSDVKANSAETDSMLDFTASQPASKDEPKEESSLADLFSGTSHQEEKSSLTAILERTPDASMDELLNDLNDIREMLRGRLDEE